MEFILLFMIMHLVRANADAIKDHRLDEFYSNLTGNLKTNEFIRITELNARTLEIFASLISTYNTHLKSIEISNAPGLFPNRRLNLSAILSFNKNLELLNISNNQLVAIDSDNNNDNNDTMSTDNVYPLKFLQLSFNQIGSLDFLVNKTFAKLEQLVVNGNNLSHISRGQVDSLDSLNFLDLSRNQIELLHPAVLQETAKLKILDLSQNRLRAFYLSQSVNQLEYLNLNENPIMCDCTLVSLLKPVDGIVVQDNFTCQYNQHAIRMDNLNESFLQETCTKPVIAYDVSQIESTSKFTQLEFLARQWFNWYIFPDNTYREPFIEPSDAIDAHIKIDGNTSVPNLHVYSMSDIKLKCIANGSPEPAIVWQTSFGYFTNINTSLYEQIFHKLGKLIKVHGDMTVRLSTYGSAQSINRISVTDQNELSITNVRQKFVGKLSCLAVNGAGLAIVDFYVDIRAGVRDQFFYCLLVGVVSAFISCLIGSIACAINEKHAVAMFPMTPPIHPTPFDTNATPTPPNFDLNQWMTQAASNITETLEQVKKKLHKGVEKASITVKSIGVHSSSYLYSVYEHGTQRLSNIKSYVPTLNVPTITLPTSRYTNQLVTRMDRLRVGVADYFFQIREFCGTSDMMHTVSMATIHTDTNAANNVGHIDIDIECTPNHQMMTESNQLNNIKEDDADTVEQDRPLN
jgi:hypothetical protein